MDNNTIKAEKNVILNNVSYNLNTDYLEFLEMKI